MDTPSHIAIIILNWNGKKDTLECLASLRQVNHPSFTVIVVDNGSSDDSVAEIRREFPEVVLIETKENLGYAGGNNRGISYALAQDFDSLLLLNNDTIVDPEFLRALDAKMQANPQIGILGCCTLLYGQRDTLDHLGGKWNSKKGSFDLIGNRCKETLITDNLDLDYACGCALFVKREVFEKVGLFEERFFLIWEEADFCFRAKRAGYGLSYSREARLWHKVSASFTGGKPHTTYYWWRNRFFWIERNLPYKDRLSCCLRVLFPEILRIGKLALLRKLQLLFLSSKREERRERLMQYKAALTGTKDYFLRRFGNGPSWLFKPSIREKSL